jgi:hypothetical protein
MDRKYLSSSIHPDLRCNHELFCGIIAEDYLSEKNTLHRLRANASAMWFYSCETTNGIKDGAALTKISFIDWTGTETHDVSFQFLNHSRRTRSKNAQHPVESAIEPRTQVDNIMSFTQVDGYASDYDDNTPLVGARAVYSSQKLREEKDKEKEKDGTDGTSSESGSGTSSRGDRTPTLTTRMVDKVKDAWNSIVSKFPSPQKYLFLALRGNTYDERVLKRFAAKHKLKISKDWMFASLGQLIGAIFPQVCLSRFSCSGMNQGALPSMNSSHLLSDNLHLHSPGDFLSEASLEHLKDFCFSQQYSFVQQDGNLRDTFIHNFPFTQVLTSDTTHPPIIVNVETPSSTVPLIFTISQTPSSPSSPTSPKSFVMSNIFGTSSPSFSPSTRSSTIKVDQPSPTGLSVLSSPGRHASDYHDQQSITSSTSPSSKQNSGSVHTLHSDSVSVNANNVPIIKTKNVTEILLRPPNVIAQIRALAIVIAGWVVLRTTDRTLSWERYRNMLLVWKEKNYDFDHMIPNYNLETSFHKKIMDVIWSNAKWHELRSTSFLRFDTHIESAIYVHHFGGTRVWVTDDGIFHTRKCRESGFPSRSHSKSYLHSVISTETSIDSGDPLSIDSSSLSPSSHYQPKFRSTTLMEAMSVKNRPCYWCCDLLYEVVPKK